MAGLATPFPSDRMELYDSDLFWPLTGDLNIDQRFEMEILGTPHKREYHVQITRKTDQNVHVKVWYD